MELKYTSSEDLGTGKCGHVNSIKASLGAPQMTGRIETGRAHSMYLTITDVTSYTDEECTAMHESSRIRHNESRPYDKLKKKLMVSTDVLQKLAEKLASSISGDDTKDLMESPGVYTYNVTPGSGGVMVADLQEGLPEHAYPEAMEIILRINDVFSAGLLPMNENPNAPPDAPKTYGSVADRSFTVILDTTPAIYSKEEPDENEVHDDIYIESGHKVLSPNGSIRKTASSVTKEELEGLFFEPPSVYR